MAGQQRGGNEKTYDAFNPPKKVTDPDNRGVNRDYPAHVFKWAGYVTDEDGNVVTEGREKKPIPLPNEYLEVKDDKGKADAVKDGWALSPVLEPPVAPKGKQKD